MWRVKVDVGKRYAQEEDGQRHDLCDHEGSYVAVADDLAHAVELLSAVVLAGERDCGLTDGVSGNVREALYALACGVTVDYV